MISQFSYTPVNLTDEANALMDDLVGQALVILDAAGYVVVPKLPTHEMVTEGRHPATPGSVSEIYKEMIKARPEVVLKEYAPTKWDAAATLVLK
jgi:hypothetical protein